MLPIVRAAGAFATALVLSFAAIRVLIPFLRRRKWQQVFRGKEEVRDLADLHASKAHTPTMGGLAIWLGAALATLLWSPLRGDGIAVLAIFTAFGAIGLCDDAAKVFSRSSRGMAGRRRLLLQGMAVLALFFFLRLAAADGYRALHEPLLPLPFASIPLHLPGAVALAFSFLVLAGSANGVNLTDGLDGLAAGCSLLTAAALAAIAFFENSLGIAIPLVALAGSLLAFLWYNANPAQIFMGDTGSLAIGGLLGTAALLLRQPFFLAIAGGIFVLETLSVLLQVYYFKWTGGRRIFRMAPLHHHLELGGWPETRVTTRLWLLSALFALSALALYPWRACGV
ncbi:MAG: phospho-N-acetylmuramoyl-pentapeptide-transferase [Puniceicoccales bacterium]|nr:phospho-N-acetylmuramoyl-pentapeptide-transferase [Puniceicoccales bacterium]